MFRNFYTLLLCLSFLICGCGKKEEPAGPAPESKETPALKKEATETAKPEEVAQLEAVNVLYAKPEALDEAVTKFIANLGEIPELKDVDKPVQMTYYFVKALQTGDENAVFGMLTAEAYSERVRTKVPLTPGFPENVDIMMGNVQYLQDENQQVVGAQVGTTWTETDPADEGQTVENRIVWVLRNEGAPGAEKWRVAGMICIVDPQLDPILVNFEDMEETLKKYKEIEEQLLELEKSSTDSAGGPARQVEDESEVPETLPTDLPATLQESENGTKSLPLPSSL